MVFRYYTIPVQKSILCFGEGDPMFTLVFKVLGFTPFRNRVCS